MIAVYVHERQAQEQLEAALLAMQRAAAAAITDDALLRKGWLRVACMAAVRAAHLLADAQADGVSRG